MYFVYVESYNGEDYIACGTTINDAINNLRNMTTEYIPENVVFYKGGEINVKTEVHYIET